MTSLANQVFNRDIVLNPPAWWRRMRAMVTASQVSPQRWTAAVIMERSAVVSRWASEKWEAKGVVPDIAPGSTPRVLLDRPELTRVLHSGLQIVLRRDEAEGHYMNITSPEPKVFVLWRMVESMAVPQLLTVSYHEGARWMDSGDNVDGVPLPAELLPWIAVFCEKHYHPEPRKKTRYATSRDKGRMGNWRPD